MNDEKVLYVCTRCFEETGGDHAKLTDRMLHRRPIRILRLKQVSAMTGLGHSMIYQLQAEKRFPRAIRIIAFTRRVWKYLGTRLIGVAPPSLESK